MTSFLSTWSSSLRSQPFCFRCPGYSTLELDLMDWARGNSHAYHESPREGSGSSSSFPTPRALFVIGDQVRKWKDISRVAAEENRIWLQDFSGMGVTWNNEGFLRAGRSVRSAWGHGTHLHNRQARFKGSLVRIRLFLSVRLRHSKRRQLSTLAARSFVHCFSNVPHGPSRHERHQMRTGMAR